MSKNGDIILCERCNVFGRLNKLDGSTKECTTCDGMGRLKVVHKSLKPMNREPVDVNMGDFVYVLTSEKGFKFSGVKLLVVGENDNEITVSYDKGMMNVNRDRMSRCLLMDGRVALYVLGEEMLT